MATYEHNALQNYKDNDGNIHILYPVTKSDNVDGIENYATTTDMNTKIATKADYEVGTWTPVFKDTSETEYTSTKPGTYMRIGNRVFLYLSVDKSCGVTAGNGDVVRLS